MTERARYWSDLLAAWHRSGLSQAEFCRRRGVNGGTFAWWKRQLRDVASVRASSDGGKRGPRAGRATAANRLDCEAGAGRFVEVRMPSAWPSYEVVLAGGRSIRVPLSFDTESLSRLISAVESC